MNDEEYIKINKMEKFDVLKPNHNKYNKKDNK